MPLFQLLAETECELTTFVGRTQKSGPHDVPAVTFRLKLASVVNPKNKPTGPYTGRCKRCGSDDLWDDCTAYGCNNCGAVYSN
jgi:hypothetical protein